MKIEILKGCVGDNGETLKVGDKVEQSPNTTRSLIGAGQAKPAETKPAKKKAAMSTKDK